MRTSRGRQLVGNRSFAQRQSDPETIGILRTPVKTRRASQVQSSPVGVDCLISPEHGGSGATDKFYKGGQFMPSGWRAPAGGAYARDMYSRDIPHPQRAYSSRSTPQRLGYYTSPSSPAMSSHYSGSSGGEARFYKGGQFIPGGGRAPKGGGYY